MSNNSYFHWLTNNTPTTWWHDSGDQNEIEFALENHASGVTTNPVLMFKTLSSTLDKWTPHLESMPESLSTNERTEFLIKTVAQNVAVKFQMEFERSNGQSGYVCAQVNPALATDREMMVSMARRFYKWAPNIAVKLPVTAAGLDALEDCIAEGITIAATVSFTVPQVLAVAQRHQKGIERARKDNKQPGRCFAVIMIGRIDDYLHDIVKDRKLDLSESEIKQAGLAITKQAYSLYLQNNYETTLLIAALRGTYHMEQLAGGKLIMSIHPKYQKMLLQPGLARQIHIDDPVDPQVIQKLKSIPEFNKAYEPDGMLPEDFFTFGVTQKTLSQFNFAGWTSITNLPVHLDKAGLV